MNKIKIIFYKFIFRILGKERLMYRFAKELDWVELSRFNQVAGSFKIFGDKELQFVTLFNVLPQYKHFGKALLKNYLENGNNYTSQLGQDCIVNTLYNHKENGVFIEIGVGDGIGLSNTYYFEKNKNWTGVLCEPARQFYKSISLNRKAIFLNKAVYNTTGEVLEFQEAVDGEFSTLSEFISTSGIADKENSIYEVETISFNDICSQHLQSKKIDYLSVDTEGSEYEILSQINFDTTYIGIISVEHNYINEKKQKIHTLLSKHGFIEILKNKLSWDAMYIHKSLIVDFENEFKLT